MVVPTSISNTVTSSTRRELYSPMLYRRLEKPPVERAHMAWSSPSNSETPLSRYKITPSARKPLYIRKITWAVRPILGIRRSE